MNAEVVYQVAMSLPIPEQKELLNMLQKEFGITSNTLRKQKQPVLTKEVAYAYLLKNVFDTKE